MKAGDIEFNLEIERHLVDDQFCSDLEKILRKHFNSVVINFLPRLTTDSSGKFRYIISMLKQE